MSPTVHSARHNWWRTLLLAAVALALFLLCASVVVAAVETGRAKPRTAADRAAPELTVQGERTMQGAKLSVRGSGWPARTELTLRASPPPGAADSLDLGTSMSNSEGSFRATKLSPCTSRNEADAARPVTVVVRGGGASAQARLTADPFICMAAR